jgi:hydroxymethylbilane synthase
MRTLEGGCSIPIGVETSWTGGTDNQTLSMRAVVASLDGTEAVEGKREGTVRNREEAEAFGSKMAEELVRRGAGRVLEAILEQKKVAGEERID